MCGKFIELTSLGARYLFRGNASNATILYVNISCIMTFYPLLTELDGQVVSLTVMVINDGDAEGSYELLVAHQVADVLHRIRFA